MKSSWSPMSDKSSIVEYKDLINFFLSERESKLIFCIDVNFFCKDSRLSTTSSNPTFLKASSNS